MSYPERRLGIEEFQNKKYPSEDAPLVFTFLKQECSETGVVSGALT